MDFLQAQISQRSTNVDRLSQLINQGKNFDYENWKEGADKTFQEQLTKFSDLGQRAVSEKIASEGEAIGAFTGAPAAYKLGTGFYKYGLGESGKGFFDRGATKAIGYRDVAIDKVKAKFASDKAPVEEEPAVAQEAETGGETTGLEDALLGFGGETTAASTTAATTTEGARFAIFPGQVQPEVAEAEAAQIQASQAATEGATTAATEGATEAATEGATDAVVSDVVGDGAAAVASTGIGAPIVGAIAAAGALTFGLVELFGHHSHHPHRPTLPSFSAGAIASQYNLGSTILPNIANQAKEIGTSVF